MIETARLLLRPWRAGDLVPFAAQNADPIVMRYLIGPLTREQSDAYAAAAARHLAETGYCKWAVEVPGIAPFIGAVGLSRVKFTASFTPPVEVAWRLHRDYRGRGYATEAARAAIEDGFTRVGPREIVALTTLANTQSQRVMERLGMTRTIEFDHPAVPPDSPPRRHILYRLAARPVEGKRARERDGDQQQKGQPRPGLDRQRGMVAFGDTGSFRQQDRNDAHLA
jgi:RimJ/RimL family protein N-acetyltransferase